MTNGPNIMDSCWDTESLAEVAADLDPDYEWVSDRIILVREGGSVYPATSSFGAFIPTMEDALEMTPTELNAVMTGTEFGGPMFWSPSSTRDELVGLARKVLEAMEL